MAEYQRALDKAIFRFFRAALAIGLRRPRHLALAVRCMRNQFAAAQKRKVFEKAGRPIPPLLILSVTGRCNLSCKGCYSHHLGFSEKSELSQKEIFQILTDAERLGIGTVLMAGGEPLLRANDIWALAEAFPRLLFAVFTNGLLIDGEMIRRMKELKNFVPVISIEGHNKDTDLRRGPGVAHRLAGVLETLRHKRIFFGVSVTVTKANLDHILSPEFSANLQTLGCHLLFHVEYVPVEAGSEELAIEIDQRKRLLHHVEALRKRESVLTVAFPGEEEDFGGCLAAGRGFVHISPSGMLEPCPFAPYSDTNLAATPLFQGLSSPLLSAIRANHAQLQETRGGCALWNQREWVRSLSANCPPK